MTKRFFVYAGLFLFAMVYNEIVSRLEAHGHDRGYMGFIVAVGCLGTLLGAAILIGWNAFWRVFECFVAAGLPMIWGSVTRHIRERDNVARMQREDTGKYFMPGG